MNQRMIYAAMTVTMLALIGLSLAEPVEAKSRSRSSFSSSRSSPSGWKTTPKYRSTTVKPSLKPVPRIASKSAKARMTVNNFKPSGKASTIPPIAPKGMTIPKPPASMKNLYYQPKHGYMNATKPYMHKNSDGTFLKIIGGMALGAFAYSFLADDAQASNGTNKLYCVTQEGSDSKVLAVVNIETAWNIFKNNNVPMNCYDSSSELVGALR